MFFKSVWACESTLENRVFHQITPCGTLDFQKMPDKMQKNLGPSIHQVWRKRPKCSKMVDFHHILDVFSGVNDQIDLNPFASCQASSGTSLE